MDPISLSIAAGGAALSAYQASEKNKGIQRSMDAANTATGEELAQINAQRLQERAKRIRESEKVRGTIAVNAAERGTGFGGSTGALDRQALYDEASNVGTVDTNANSTQRHALSGLTATNIHLANQSTSVLGAMLQGGLSGLSTGLSIGRAIPKGSAPGLPQPNDASIIMPGDEPGSTYT